MRCFCWNCAALATPCAGRPLPMCSRCCSTCLRVPGLGTRLAAVQRQRGAAHLCGDGRGDGQRHKLGGEAQGRQLPRRQLAVHAVERGVVCGEAVEVGVHAPGAQQPRQRPMELPVHRTKDAASGFQSLPQCMLNECNECTQKLETAYSVTEQNETTTTKLTSNFNKCLGTQACAWLCLLQSCDATAPWPPHRSGTGQPPAGSGQPAPHVLIEL